jgi:uncharacterized repeat protein (TIGR01451 family)
MSIRKALAPFGAALALGMLLGAARADATPISVNKTFTPNSIALGGTSVVTVTLQNSDTTSAAAISNFEDDITTMSGDGVVDTAAGVTTTCPGGTPTIAGQVVSMTNGAIPEAPSSTQPGSCTITFSVLGNHAGNGMNTIAAANVTTSLGSPLGDVTQTLAVLPANVTVSASANQTTLVGSTGQLVFTVTNPAAGVALTNAGFSINGTSTVPFTVSSAVSSCGGTVTTPGAGVTSGTISLSGATIPASGTCTITVQTTSSAVSTVNYTLPIGSVTDDQGATNSGAASDQNKFVVGSPNVSKSFNPTAILPGTGTSVLTINIANVLSSQALTAAQIIDPLPTGLTLDAAAPTYSNCGTAPTPTLTGVGTGTITVSNMTIPAATTCVIHVTVDASSLQGSVTNTIPANDFTATVGTGTVTSSAAAASASLLVTGPGGGISTGKTAAPTSAGPNVPILITLTFNSLAGGAFTNGTFTDNLPQTPQPMAAVNTTGYLPTTTNCGSTPTLTVTPGSTSVSGSNLSIASGSTCTVKFYVEFTTPTPGVNRIDTNTLQASNVSFTGTAGAVSPGSSPAVNITELPVVTLSNYVASGQNLVNQPISVTASMNDTTGTTDNNFVATFPLTATKVQLAPSPNFTFGGGCPSGLSTSNITIGTNGESFTVNVGTISATCTITYNVIDEGGVSGTFTPGNPSYTSQLSGGATASFTATNAVTFSTTNINITKAFSPNQIQSGSQATTSIGLTVSPVSGFTQTTANGVAYSDALPAGLSFATPANVAFVGCQQTGQPAPSYAITGQTIAFSNLSLLTVGSTPTTCMASFSVTSTTLGARSNIIASGAITSTAGVTNSQGVNASITVQSGIAIAKTYVSPTLQIGGTDYIRFLVTNSISSNTLTGGTLVDNMPSALSLASTTLGPALAGDPAACPASITVGTVGSSSFTVGNIQVPGAPSASVPGQCVIYVLVKASPTAAPGATTNTIGVGQLNVGGYANQTGTSANTTLTAAPNVTLAKAFSPITIAPGGTSTLTITVANTSNGSAPLSGMTLADTLPAGMTIAPTPNASTTCGAGTVTAVAGASSVALANGSMAANATCTIAVTVTSGTSGISTNTIPANAFGSTQGATNAAPASAVLNIGNVSAVTLAKSFSPVAIPVNGTSTLTISIANTATNAVPLTSIGLSDGLPANVTIAATPNAATTCTGGTVTANPGGTALVLSGASLAAGATCTMSASVTSATTGIYVNTIPASSLSDAQGSTNAAPAQATLNVGNSSGVAIAKTFAPVAIPTNGSSTLTIQIVNAASDAVALSGMSLTDTLPTNVRVAATPNATTTCGAGTVAAAPGATAVSLSGGSVAAGASCTISLSVTSATGGIYVNTIPPGSLGDAQGSTNAAPAQATLNVGNASGVTVAKAFAPSIIAPGATSLLTITVSNTSANAAALTSLALTDPLPTNVTLAAAPNASTTCTGGSVSAAAGGTTISLSGASIAAHASCTIVATVTASVTGTDTNTIPPGAVTTGQGATNGAPAQATLTVGQPSLVVTKTSNPSGTSVSPGQTIAYTIAVHNTGTLAETNAHVTDVLGNATLVPGSVTVNGTAAPDAVVTAGQSFGSIAVGATATIVYRATVNATAATGAAVTNTATVGGDQPCTGGSCAGTSPANTVAPPMLVATKLIDGKASESVLAGQTVTYSIAVANTGAGPAIAATFTDDVPKGITVVNGSVLVNGSPATHATLVGQTLTVPLGTIAGGTTATVTFRAKIGTTAGAMANVASVGATGITKPVASSTATATEVPSTIVVTKTASTGAASIGDRVNYSIVVAPASGIAYGTTTVIDTLPDYEYYASGTSRVQGKPQEPIVRGRILTWTLPSLASPVTITYATVVSPGAPQSATLTNVVTASAVAPGGAGVGRGSASASVLVVGSTIGSCYPITGRVYLDSAKSGRFEDPDVGIAKVHIYLDDGESVETDATGRYDFPCVRPGMHALRLDVTTLPTGIVAHDDRNIDNETSTHRLVHRTFDTLIIEDINFAVTTAPKPKAP